MSIIESIKTFLEHSSSLDTVDANGDDGYVREFKAIVRESRQNIAQNTYPATFGEQQDNLKKNRYKDILPYDHSRVVLPKLDDDEYSDYINANFVIGVTGKKSYIASQGPQPATIDDFWRMLWHFRVNVVIMVCNEFEGISKMKCKRYWPDPEQTISFVNNSLKLQYVEEHDYHCYKLRILQVTCGEVTRLLYQLHYTMWPDHSVPTNLSSILDMLAYARQYQPTESVPLVVHCSAGCGRTGTVIALDYTWSLLKEGKLRPDYSIYKLILNFRTQRPSMVQSEEQYTFLYKAVSALFQRHLTMLEDHLYENVEPVCTDLTKPVPNQASKPNSFNASFPSPKPTLPENARTPEVPILLPAPTKRRSAATAERAPNSPASLPPKPRHISFNSSESPSNTVIRSTINRLLSSTGSESEMEIYANMTSEGKPKPLNKPNTLGLTSIEEASLGSKPPIKPKPVSTPDIESRKLSASELKASPRRVSSDSNNEGRNEKTTKKLVDFFNKQSSQDEDAKRSPSDSSSTNTVFTSDKSSPGAISDNSVFDSDGKHGTDHLHSPGKPAHSSKDKIPLCLENKNRKHAELSSEYSLMAASDATSEYALQGATEPAPQKPSYNNKSPTPPSTRTERTSFDPIEIPKTAIPKKVTPVSNATTPDLSNRARVRRERVYEEIENIDQEVEPVISDAADTDPIEGCAYAYVGDDEGHKWSLQQIALGKAKPSDPFASSSPPKTEYAASYSSVPEPEIGHSDSSNDEAAPNLPCRDYSSQAAERQIAHQPGLKLQTIGRMFGKNIAKIQRKKVKADSAGPFLSPTEPPAIMFKNKDISFGKRVCKPKGKRPSALKHE